MEINTTIYDFMMYFFIYGFLGWCCEVAFATRHGCFVNRGFLNGPICPIYGVGVGLVVTLLKPYSNNIAALYVGGTVLVTVVEYFTGLIMDKMFHHKWWDYSNKPLNIGGYVCLLFSLVWGVALVLIMRIVNPLIDDLINLIPMTVGVVILIILEIALASDIIVTVIGVNRLNGRLEAMAKISEEMKKLSNDIGEGIYGPASAGMEELEKVQDSAEEHKEEAEQSEEERSEEQYEDLEKKAKEAEEKAKQLEDLANQYDAIAADHNVQSRRLLRAFPYMTSNDHNEHLDAMKKYAPVNPRRAAEEARKEAEKEEEQAKKDEKEAELVKEREEKEAEHLKETKEKAEEKAEAKEKSDEAVRAAQAAGGTGAELPSEEPAADTQADTKTDDQAPDTDTQTADQAPADDAEKKDSES